MAAVDDVSRPSPLHAGGEAEMLWSMVDHYRATALLKCKGLDDDQLRIASCPPSRLTLLGILRHLTDVEQFWFENAFCNRRKEPHYSDPSDRDADLFALESPPADQVVATYLAQCEVSREIASTHDLDDLAKHVPAHWNVGEINLRYLGIHMVDEYARHCGHMDRRSGVALATPLLPHLALPGQRD
jgi:hypothetical protein